jgi:hypothetical protein
VSSLHCAVAFAVASSITGIDASPKVSLRMFDLYMVLNFLFLFWSSVIPRYCHLHPALAGSGAPRRNHFRPSLVFIMPLQRKKSGAFQENGFATLNG